MTATADCTTAPALPLAHRANVDAPGQWQARVAALEALRDTFIAQGCEPGLAADRAILQLDSDLEAQAIAEAAAAAKLSAARERARVKAQYHLAGGLELRRVGSAVLVPSGTRGGTIHRVEGGACSCEAAQAGRVCWHVLAVELAPPAPASVEDRAVRVARLMVEARARLQAA
jgi:hypothetical protein